MEEVNPDSSKLLATLRKVRDQGQASPAHEFTIRLAKKPDQELHLIDFHFPVEVDGEVKAIGTVVLDITERKLVERKLREAAQSMEAVISSLGEAVFVVTPDLALVCLNEAGERMFGYSKEELANLAAEVLHVDHEHYVDFGNRIREAFDRGESAHFEFELRRKNGEVFPSSHTSSKGFHPP